MHMRVFAQTLFTLLDYHFVFLLFEGVEKNFFFKKMEHLQSVRKKSTPFN